jgi:DNA-binding transcriptional LysR family regulator
MDMREIWRLHHFLAVAETGGFHAASRQLNLSQPALTKSIRQLEASLGSELFRRHPRGVSMTEAGELLYRRAREIQAAWTAVNIEMGAQLTGQGGVMHIGGGPVYSAVHFPTMLADLRHRFPNLSIQVTTGVGGELLPLLEKGTIRAYAGGIPDESMPLGPEFQTEVLYHQASAIFASKDHPLFRRDVIRPEDTLDFPWLGLFSGLQANRRITDYFSRCNLPSPAQALQSHSLQIAFKMMAEHQFVGCMPVPLAEAHKSLGLREVYLDNFRWSIPTGLTFHRSSTGFGPIVQMLRSLRSLTKAFADL